MGWNHDRRLVLAEEDPEIPDLRGESWLLDLSISERLSGLLAYRTVIFRPQFPGPDRDLPPPVWLQVFRADPSRLRGSFLPGDPCFRLSPIRTSHECRSEAESLKRLRDSLRVARRSILGL